MPYFIRVTQNVPLEYDGFEEWLSSTLTHGESSVAPIVPARETNAPTSVRALPSRSPSAVGDGISSYAAARHSPSGIVLSAMMILALRLLSSRAH